MQESFGKNVNDIWLLLITHTHSLSHAHTHIRIYTLEKNCTHTHMKHITFFCNLHFFFSFLLFFLLFFFVLPNCLQFFGNCFFFVYKHTHTHTHVSSLYTYRRYLFIYVQIVYRERQEQTHIENNYYLRTKVKVIKLNMVAFLAPTVSTTVISAYTLFCLFSQFVFREQFWPKLFNFYIF